VAALTLAMTGPAVPSSPTGEAAIGPDPAALPLATWGQRVTAAFFDYVLPVVALGVIAGFTTQRGSGAVIAFLAAMLANLALQGTTGQTLGKRRVGISLVAERDRRPIGVGPSVLRAGFHIFDSIPFYIGWFAPLWDAKHQTFADKLARTLVIVGQVPPRS